MKLYAFDFEVFAYDWLVVFKDIADNEFIVVHNDNYGVKQFVTEDKLFIGFNSKSYDRFILQAVLCGADNRMVKEINDFIIDGGAGWEHWFLQENKAWFNVADISDDMQIGMSLKAIEGHLGMNIEESTVPFDIDRPLTKQELEEVITYCKYDVDMVVELVKLRKSYLQAKLSLGRMKGIPDARALYYTNAKLTAMFLDAKQVPRSDERNYKYPDNLNRNRIPKEVFEFFDRMHDPELSDDEVFKSKLEFQLQDMTCVVGYGGLHSALPNYVEVSEESEN